MDSKESAYKKNYKPEYDSALTEEEKNLDDTEECEMCKIRTLPSELTKNFLGMYVCEHCS